MIRELTLQTNYDFWYHIEKYSSRYKYWVKYWVQIQILQKIDKIIMITKTKYQSTLQNYDSVIKKLL